MPSTSPIQSRDNRASTRRRADDVAIHVARRHHREDRLEARRTPLRDQELVDAHVGGPVVPGRGSTGLLPHPLSTSTKSCCSRLPNDSQPPGEAPVPRTSTMSCANPRLTISALAPNSFLPYGSKSRSSATASFRHLREGRGRRGASSRRRPGRRRSSRGSCPGRKPAEGGAEGSSRHARWAPPPAQRSRSPPPGPCTASRGPVSHRDPCKGLSSG